jgi:proliferating cell nuclear antigen PCNA
MLFKTRDHLPQMPIIFKAKTREGYAIKILAEILQNNIKSACFEVDQSGITLRMTDSHKTILIDLVLDSDNFVSYKFRTDTKLFLGINLMHFHKMLKSIKKRDSIEFFIDDKEMTDLGIKVIPKDNSRVTTSFVKIQCTQNLDIDLPVGYGKPIIVPSNEFQKMCKGMTHISKTINISSDGSVIRFACDAGGVMKRHTEFGETDGSDSDSEEETLHTPDYEDEFDTDQLARITKLSGLSNTMKVYTKTGLPIYFRSAIGINNILGEISIYIKSKSQLNENGCGSGNTEEEEES